MTGETIVAFVAAVGTILAGLGAKEVIQRWVTRRGERADAALAERKEVSAVSAQGNFDVLRLLLEETKSRVDSYEASIIALKADHAADIRELKGENRELERQVADLRISLQEYQLGNRVPLGMVLIPAHEVVQLRERYPGALMHRYYPGELEAARTAQAPPAPPPSAEPPPVAGPRTITAQITRLDDRPEHS